MTTPKINDDHHSMMNSSRISQSLPADYLTALLKAAHVLDKNLPGSPFAELHALENQKMIETCNKLEACDLPLPMSGKSKYL